MNNQDAPEFGRYRMRDACETCVAPVFPDDSEVNPLLQPRHRVEQKPSWVRPENTGDWIACIIGTVCSLVIAGFVCVIVAGELGR